MACILVKLTIEYDHDKREVISKQAILYPTEDLLAPLDNDLKQKQWDEIGVGKLSTEAFQNPKKLTKDWFQRSDMSDFFGKALLAFTEADCAMFPAGILLTDLNKGIVTDENLHSLLPHPINPCVITLTGADLLEIHRTIKKRKVATFGS